MSEALFVAFPGTVLLPLRVCVRVFPACIPDAPPSCVQRAGPGSLGSSSETDGDGPRPLWGQLRP